VPRGRRVEPAQVNFTATKNLSKFELSRLRSNCWFGFFGSEFDLSRPNPPPKIRLEPSANCIWNSLVFSYLASMSVVVCVVCSFADDEKHSCRSSVISMRSCPPQYQRSSAPLNPSTSLFLFFLSSFFLSRYI